MPKVQLPTTWQTTKLDDISLDISYGYTASSTQDDTGTKLLRITDIQNNSVHWSNVPYCIIDPVKFEKYRLRTKDLVFARTGATVGKSYLLKNDVPNAVYASYLIRVRSSESVSIDFLAHFFQSKEYWNQISDFSAGIGQPNVNGTKLKNLIVPIPSMSEQIVIADKLDALLAQVESTKARLDRIPQILKRFRQSVLKAAVSGKLTEDFCSSQWERVNIGQIALDIRYGTSKKCSESKGSTPVLRIPNIGDRYIDQKNLKFADFDAKESSKLELKPGDLLLIRSNGSLDLVGKTALVRESDSGLLFAGYLIRLRLDIRIADPGYVSICLRSPDMRTVIEEKAKSTSGVNNINSKELASLQLSLPTIHTQHKIVRRVDQLFAYADRIEQQVNNALERVNNLTQSILAKAFRGELTKQWRKDNPELISGDNSAEALLERIKAERAAMKPAKRSRKKTSA